MKPFLSSSVQNTALREENPSDFPSSATPFLSWDTISPPWTITSQSSLPLKFKRDLKLYQHPPDERVGGRTTSASSAVLPCPSSAQVSPPSNWMWSPGPDRGWDPRREHPPLGKSQATAQVGQCQSSIPDPSLQDLHHQHHQHKGISQIRFSGNQRNKRKYFLPHAITLKTT